MFLVLIFFHCRNELQRLRKQEVQSAAVGETLPQLVNEPSSLVEPVDPLLRNIESDIHVLEYEESKPEKFWQQGLQQQPETSAEENEKQLLDRPQERYHSRKQQLTSVTAPRDADQLPPTAPPPLNMPIVTHKKVPSSSG